MVFLAIIIPHVRSKSLIRSILFSLQKYPPQVEHKIILINNECTDNSIHYAKKKFPMIKVITFNKNVGFGAALNQGIRSIKAKYYLILSNDLLIFEKDWFLKLEKIAQRSENIGIVSPYYIDVSIAHIFREINLKRKKNFKIIYPNTLTGAVLLIKRKLLEDIGLFEELFYPAYFEDIDFSLRARIAGYILAKDPNTVFLHYHGATTERMYDPFYYYYNFFKCRLIFDLLNQKKRQIPKVFFLEIKYLFRNFIHDVVKRQFGSLIPNCFCIILAYLRVLNLLPLIIQKRKNRKIAFDYQSYRRQITIPFVKYLVWRNEKFRNK